MDFELDDLEDAVDRDDVLIGDGDPLAQGQDLEVGVGHGRRGGEGDGPLREARGLEGFLGRAQVVAR